MPTTPFLTNIFFDEAGNYNTEDIPDLQARTGYLTTGTITDAANYIQIPTIAGNHYVHINAHQQALQQQALENLQGQITAQAQNIYQNQALFGTAALQVQYPPVEQVNMWQGTVINTQGYVQWHYPLPTNTDTWQTQPYTTYREYMEARPYVKVKKITRNLPDWF